MGEQPAINIVTGPDKADWTKVDAYLPNSNITSLSAAFNAHIVSNNAVYYTHMDADHVPPGAGRARHIIQRNRIVMFLDEVHQTTTTNVSFSIVCNGARLDQNTIPTGLYGGGVSNEIVGPLAGYEQYQTANWDQFDAEPITADTLKYARRLMNIMPTSFGDPDIAPAADGSIALEWVPVNATHSLNKLFLDIGPGEEWRASWKLRDGTFDRIVGSGFPATTKGTLKSLFDKLSG